MPGGRGWLGEALVRYLKGIPQQTFGAWSNKWVVCWWLHQLNSIDAKDGTCSVA